MTSTSHLLMEGSDTYLTHVMANTSFLHRGLLDIDFGILTLYCDGIIHASNGKNRCYFSMNVMG